MLDSSKKKYFAKIRKDPDGRWAADLYKEGKLMYSSWQWNWKTKKAMVAEITAIGIPFGKGE